MRVQFRASRGHGGGTPNEGREGNARGGGATGVEGCFSFFSGITEGPGLSSRGARAGCMLPVRVQKRWSAASGASHYGHNDQAAYQQDVTDRQDAGDHHDDRGHRT